jgi:hypothetical protein
MELYVTFQFYFRVPRVEVRQDLVFSFQSNEGGRTVTSVNRLYDFCLSLMKNCVCILLCAFHSCTRSELLPYARF